MFLNRIIRFGVFVDKSHRYFLLRYSLKQGKLAQNQSSYSKYLQHINNYQLNDQLLFAGNNGPNHYYVFSCYNQSQPYEYLNAHPLRSIIDSYQIEQFNIGLKSADKQLAPKYLRQ